LASAGIIGVATGNSGHPRAYLVVVSKWLKAIKNVASFAEKIGRVVPSGAVVVASISKGVVKTGPVQIHGARSDRFAKVDWHMHSG
jgi:hypothetical protein